MTEARREKLAKSLEGYASAYDNLHRDIADDFREAARIVRIEHSTPDRNAVLEEAAKVAEDHIPDRNGSVADASAKATARAIAGAIRALTTTPEPTDEPPAQVIDLDREALTMLGEAAAQSNWIPPEYMANDWLSDCATFLRTGQGATPEPTDPARVSEMAVIPEQHRFCGDHSDLRMRFNSALAGGPNMNGDSGPLIHTNGHAEDLEFAIEVIGELRTPSPVLEVAKEALELALPTLEGIAAELGDDLGADIQEGGRPPQAAFDAANTAADHVAKVRGALQTLKEGMGSDVPKGLGDV